MNTELVLYSYAPVPSFVTNVFIASVIENDPCNEPALTYSGLRHLALCCLQTNVLFPWLREPVLYAPDARHRSPVRMTS